MPHLVAILSMLIISKCKATPSIYGLSLVANGPAQVNYNSNIRKESSFLLDDDDDHHHFDYSHTGRSM